MAFKLFDRIQETASTTGTGDFTLSGAITGFKTFASRYSTGDTLYYCIQAVDGSGVPTGDWEVGLGAYSAANTLTRTTVLSSSNSDALVSFTSGEKRVFVTMTALQGASIRERLTAARTYYVRTDGSDSNDGLANTSARAFLTIQKAIDVVSSSLNIGTYDVTIQVADGTYTGAITARPVISSGGFVIINGNSGTPTNVVINPTSATCFTNISGSIFYSIKYVKLTTTTSGNCIYCGVGSRVYFYGIDFGAAPGSTHIYAEQGGRIQAQANYTISGAANYHYLSAGQAEIRVTGTWTVTVTGSPAFNTFAYASSLGFIHHANVTFSGTVTGKRYDVLENSIVKTYGGGANYFPGNAAGTTATGGQYT